MEINNNTLLYLKIMLRELDDFYLDIKLIPAPEPMFSGHKIRSVEKQIQNGIKNYVQDIQETEGIGRINIQIQKLKGRKLKVCFHN